MPGCGRPALLGHDCHGVLQMGRDSQGCQCPGGPWNPDRKEAPLPCWASQGMGARPGRERRATRSFPATIQQYGHSSGCHLGSRSYICSPQQTKPNTSPTWTKKMVVDLFYFFFNFKSNSLTYFSANRQLVPQALIQQGLSPAPVVSSFYTATEVATCTHTCQGMPCISKSGISILCYIAIQMCSKICLAYAMKQCR